ncbi:peptidylprolyl isomerase [Novosphingobium sp. M1R2S20]|uniref:peptidylprolyl isomerase n=1 Tax=Novosphingobium rhizovicinum TaxID=3228928 RepID=A0ABV3RBM4_9SPHN
MAIRRAFALLSLPVLVSVGGTSGAAPAEKRAVAAHPASPAEIVAQAPAAHWRAIPARDLLVMELPALTPTVTLAALPVEDTGAAAEAALPDNAPSEPSAIPMEGDDPEPARLPPRRIVIQLITPPYSQGWVANIRALAAAHWWDGLAIVRAQDNYVVQWGDPFAADGALARALPAGLQKMPSEDYAAGKAGGCGQFAEICPPAPLSFITSDTIRDVYADRAGFVAGWPVAVTGARTWPVHCYGTVGVGRDVTPDTGSGAELYAVIGHAPRQLDRNIAVVGRVIEGMEHLSTLPRGTGELGFYETTEERTPILSIRSGEEVEGLAQYEYLASASDSFARYMKARANRQDDFYAIPAGAVDVCNVQVPIRKAAQPAPEAENTGKRRRRR